MGVWALEVGGVGVGGWGVGVGGWVCGCWRMGMGCVCGGSLQKMLCCHNQTDPTSRWAEALAVVVC